MKPLESIDKCTTCSICTVSCPVTTATQKFKGPKLIGPSAERFRILTHEEMESLEYCSNCKGCDSACPSNVQVASLNMLARSQYNRKHKPPLRDWILSHAPVLAKIVQFVPYQLQKIGLNNPITRWVLDKIGIDARATIPLFKPKTFEALLTKHNKKYKKKSLPKKVVFFPGCYINYYDPQTGMDLVFILEKAGYEVLLPKVGCCTLPLISNGFYDSANKIATRNSKELQHWAELQIPIITMCPSCAIMLKQDYIELFPDLKDTVQSFSGIIEDSCAFVTKLIENNEISLNPKSLSTKLIYHTACHLKAQGIGKPGFDLIKSIQGSNIEDAQASCCGISGSYGFKKDKYDIATAVGSTLFTAINESGAEYALSECGTCRLQMTHHTGITSVHPLTWLRNSLN